MLDIYSILEVPNSDVCGSVTNQRYAHGELSWYAIYTADRASLVL